MARVMYFWGGEEEARTWGIAHGGESEVLLYGETEQVPREGDFVFLQSATTMDGDIHQYWAKVKAVQLVAFQPSENLGETFTTEVRVFLDEEGAREETSRFNRSSESPEADDD